MGNDRQIGRTVSKVACSQDQRHKNEAFLLNNLSNAVLEQKDLTRAEELMHNGIDVAQEFKNSRGEGNLWVTFGEIAMGAGDRRGAYRPCAKAIGGISNSLKLQKG